MRICPDENNVMRPEPSRSFAIGTLLLGFFLAGIPARLAACQICLPFPTTSAAEHLIEAEMVVLAREDDLSPSSVRTVEVLKGDPGDAPMDIFLDRPPRPSLSLNSSRKIICASLGDGPEEGWKLVGMADQSFETVVRAILERSADWEAEPQKRWEFFAQQLDHKNGQVSSLAHLEVAMAPYDQIKKFGGAIPVEDLRAFLNNIRLFEWHALYILLLAQSEDEQAHRHIEDQVRSAARSGTATKLAAWATAWIEIDPEAALEFLEANYLTNSERTRDEMKAVLAALSVHAHRGHVQFRDRISSGYRDLLDNYPVLAPQIVSDLLAWKRWDLAPAVAKVVDAPPAELDRGALLLLRTYVRQGKEAGMVEPATGPIPNAYPGIGIVLLLAALVVASVALSVFSRTRQGQDI